MVEDDGEMDVDGGGGSAIERNRSKGFDYAVSVVANSGDGATMRSDDSRFLSICFFSLSWFSYPLTTQFFFSCSTPPHTFYSSSVSLSFLVRDQE